MEKEISKAYEPSQYEDKIYQKWENSGFFNPDNLPSGIPAEGRGVKRIPQGEEGEPFSIMMPPPNVTGVLHLGHALENSLMDAMVRFQRMKGKKALLLPGTDHAAVATQAKVEKLLVAEGIKNPRQELGREKLLEKIREYAENSKATILKQIKKMGTSCDWSRLAYTFDEARTKAVNEVFVRMYNDGLIYRGYRVVNWSVKGQSTCSDDELIHVERPAKLYYFKYNKDFPMTIATTRPETKLGDTAVAVNPNDKRYKKYIGKVFTADVGAEKPLELKIIADENVDPNFGTGALGVTPAHSAVDYEMYEKQKVKNDPIGLVAVIGADGRMTKEAGSDYEGLTTEEARAKFVKKLKVDGLFEKEEDIVQNVGTSDRFGDVAEALPMTQWFVNVNKKIPGKEKSLKELMREAVEIGHKGDASQKINITPERFEKIYFNWIDNLRDWCISRQIWWGHRIPVWYKKTEKEVTITFFRHYQTDDNLNRIGMGRKDSPLTEEGIKKAEEMQKKLNSTKFDAIFCSPLERAKRTAGIIFKNSEIIIDERMIEIDFGDLTKKKYEEIDKFREEGFPNGEKNSDVLKRVIDFLSEIMDKYQGKNIAIVSHSNIWKILENSFNKQELNIEFLKKHAPLGPIEYKLKTLQSVSIENPKGENWVQDEDTLDTWFSSGLWTFSTLGWPTLSTPFNKGGKGGFKNEDLKTFHPTSWMQMGYEILFFWMARMILMSTYALDEIPFKDVYIHGMLRDEKGKKFSKSSGNTVDPIEVSKKYGTDALRLSLLSGIAPGNDSRFYEEKVEGARNLVNKLWNIARFILSNYDFKLKHKIDEKNFTVADHWILLKFQALIKSVSEDLENYQFSQASEKLREFTWDYLADWYLEVCKFEKSDEKGKILNLILRDLLKLWHPFIPFVTEKIWEEIGDDKLLMVEKWPTAKIAPLIKGDRGIYEFELIKNIITAIRNARAENKVEPGKKIKAIIYAGKNVELIKSQEVLIKGLRTGIGELEIKEKGEKIKDAIYMAVGEVEIYLIGGRDEAKEKIRIKKEVENLEKIIKGLEGKLGNKEFLKKAPTEIVKQEKEKLKKWEGELEKLKVI